MDDQCDHKWVHQYDTFTREQYRYAASYRRSSVYYCERCAEDVEKRRVAYEQKDAPSWFDRNREMVIDSVRSM